MCEVCFQCVSVNIEGSVCVCVLRAIEYAPLCVHVEVRGMVSVFLNHTQGECLETSSLS